MTQEEKDLLLRDLCARLPYGVKGLHRGEKQELLVMDSFGSYQVNEYDAWFDEDIDIRKYKVKDFEDWNDSIDVGDGSPFIFWVKKGSKKIYDSGLEESNEY